MSGFGGRERETEREWSVVLFVVQEKTDLVTTGSTGRHIWSEAASMSPEMEAFRKKVTALKHDNALLFVPAEEIN